MEPIDGLIIVIFTLFMASMVNERMVDFIKLQFPQLWMKSVHYNDEIGRHKKIWLLSFLMSLVSTRLLKIDVIKLLISNNIGQGMSGLFDRFQESEHETEACIVGWILTALFVSLGSKFWHDLLDVVLFFKNSKRKISSFDPESVTNMDQVKQFQTEDEFAIAEKALHNEEQRLRKDYPNSSYHVGYEQVNKSNRVCIVVMDRNSPEEQSPSSSGRVSTWYNQILKLRSIEYRTSSGYIFRFPIVVYQAGPVSIANETLAVAGGAIYNKKSPKVRGTFGCIVKDLSCNDYYILTCYHCVKSKDRHQWPQYKSEDGDNEIYYDAKYVAPFKIGSIHKAYRDSRMDVAFIKPISNNLISDYRWEPNQTIPLGSREVNDKDVINKTKIWFSGITSNSIYGYIINRQFPEEIDYKDGGPKHNLNNLIVFSKSASEPFSAPCAPGDSGSIIIDAETKMALGMIVAVDSKFGYAIPLQDILSNNGMMLYMDPCKPINTA